MRIAVITTSYANNYGALLQTYALQRFLNENLSQEAVAIDYLPPWNRHPWSILSKPKNLRDFLANGYTLLNIKNFLAMKKRAKANLNFREQFIKLSDQQFRSVEELQEYKNQCDCLICGSDQIWNITIRGDKMPHSVFFLQFAKNWDNIRKIAYAPSVADPIPTGATETLREYLKIFDALSVREISDVAPLQALTQKTIHHVLDPVFLLSQQQWSDMAAPSPIKEKYILCYFLSYGGFSDKVVNKLRELTGYKVVNLNINKYDKFHSDKIIWDGSPRDFVGLVKNAEYICTNSFHCTAFSIIFRKNYIVVNKGWASSRMQSLQTVFGLEDRFVSEDSWEEWMSAVTPEMLSVDYSSMEDKIQKKINESKEYLRRALYEK